MALDTPQLADYVQDDEVTALVARARNEDLGPDSDDVTSRLLVPAGKTATATFRPRSEGRLSGAALLPAVIEAYDMALKLNPRMADGSSVAPSDEIAVVTGSLRSILGMERVALNFMTHLSGIATLAAKYVSAIEGTNARICDTRKTLPGLRGLEKYAVACGGASNHRIGLYDAVLIKDNHIADLSGDALECELKRVIKDAGRQSNPPKFVEIEVDTLDQLKVVLHCAPDMVLLDNMNEDELRRAVAIRNESAPNVLLEASGGVTLETVGSVARTGVDRISVGAITHSAPALDIGLDIL